MHLTLLVAVLSIISSVCAYGRDDHVNFPAIAKHNEISYVKYSQQIVKPITYGQIMAAEFTGAIRLATDGNWYLVNKPLGRIAIVGQDYVKYLEDGLMGKEITPLTLEEIDAMYTGEKTEDQIAHESKMLQDFFQSAADDQHAAIAKRGSYCQLDGWSCDSTDECFPVFTPGWYYCVCLSTCSTGFANALH
ncbi:hypothetical protein V1504DRAFT_465571 [Lipomyces starkeyi]